MKIDSITATAIEIPLPRQFAGSVYAMTTRCAIVTRMRTSDGLEAEVIKSFEQVSTWTVEFLLTPDQWRSLVRYCPWSGR